MTNSIYALVIGGQTKRSTNGTHPVNVDWNKLPDNAQDFIVKYGLKQYLSDAMAGASSESDAKAKIEARLAKLVSGDLSRTKGEGSDKPDTEQGRALKLAREAIRNMLKAKNKTATKEQVAEAAKKLIEAKPAYLAEAKKQLAAEAKSKEALAADDEADILADLMTDEPAEDDEPSETE